MAIDAVEEGIRSATRCLADITTDNPNVWYDGFAFATARPVVMVCSHERPDKKYPFDIQHRAIIHYVADAPSDFETLKQSLTDWMKALLNETGSPSPDRGPQSVHDQRPQPTRALCDGQSLRRHYMPESGVAVYSVKNDVEHASLTASDFLSVSAV